MATSVISDTRFINPGQNEFELQISVGYAQAGGSYVVVINSQGQRQVVNPIAEGRYRVHMGNQSILSCTTTVQDINLSTNDTCVDHEFSFAPGKITFQKRVDHQNDKVVYDIQFVQI
jgi:hypothetical protein